MIAGAMELFQSVRRYWHTMGIYSVELSQSSITNWKALFFAVSIMLLLISSTSFFLLKSTSVYEYGYSLYASSSEFNILIDFSITVWQMPNTLKFIANCENFIEKSKYCQLCCAFMFVHTNFNHIRIVI